MRVCAGGLLVRGFTILLARRSDDRVFYPGVWDVPGGHCDAGEAPAETLVRELQEELGITVQVFEEVAVLGSHGRANTETPVITCSSSGPGLVRFRFKVPSTPNCAG